MIEIDRERCIKRKNRKTDPLFRGDDVDRRNDLQALFIQYTKAQSRSSASAEEDGQ